MTIEKPMVEKIGYGFGMVLLSSVQAEIYVFLVWGPPSCVPTSGNM